MGYASIQRDPTVISDTVIGENVPFRYNTVTVKNSLHISKDGSMEYYQSSPWSTPQRFFIDAYLQKYALSSFFPREIADNLLHNLNAVRREKWTDTVSNLDFKRSSRKAWSLFRKLGDGHKATINAKHPPANKIAAHILSTTRSLRNKAHATQIKRELTELKKKQMQGTDRIFPPSYHC
ncbi:hypothetical protein JTB14_023340 [Gonioctena quinquepunctata]|nr:hypothetical protein JTB14_023340 [Gonioctena quinquepunctata]